jgi:hypothetical protein
MDEYVELVVTAESGTEIKLSYGLKSFLSIDGEVIPNAVGDNAVEMFEEITGYSIDSFIETMGNLSKTCPICGYTGPNKYSQGEPGETLTFCGRCNEKISSHRN